MKYSEFLKAVQNKSMPPVITLLGQETFLKQKAMEALLNRYLDSESKHFNYRAFTTEDLKDSSFLEEAVTLPMFGDAKILYIQDSNAMEKLMTKVKDYLQDYLDSPSAGAVLIFDLPSWEGHSKLKAALGKKSAIVEFNALSEREIPSWITGHLRSLDFQIEHDAVNALAERLGTDLQKIASELEKLMLYRSAEKRITAEDVEQMVGYSPTATVWQWGDAVLDMDAPRSIDLLEDLLFSGEEPIFCVALLAKQYEKAILAKEMVLQKVPPATIAQKIHKPVYFLQSYLKQLAKFNMEDLVRAIVILGQTDKALKSGQAQERTILHLMIEQLCNLKTSVKPVFDVPLHLVIK